MTTNDIPKWLKVKEDYTPLKDNESFIDKSTESIISLMSKFKMNSKVSKAKEANTSLRLFGILLLIVLTAISKNFSFVFLMIALCVARVAFMTGEQIKSLFKVLLPALLFGALILVPSIFLGNQKTPAIILSKVIVSVSLVMTLNLTSSFNEITRSLRFFRVPNIIIFTLDLTIKYILLLGEICSQMLKALKLRSIGKNDKKGSSLSNIIGTIFIKANESAQETTKAMECRGFCGKYVTRKRTGMKPADILYILFLIIISGAFAYLEVLI